MENDKDVLEFRIAMEYLDLEEWAAIARRLRLEDATITNIRARHDLLKFKDRMYESLCQWKKYCPEMSNISELIKALEKENLNGPASQIQLAITSYRNSDRGSKAVLQWKQICRESSNTNAMTIHDDAKKEEPVEVIDEVTDETTDEGPVDVPSYTLAVTEPTCAESVAKAAKPLKRIKVGSSDITNVSFSCDGMWFSTVEKGSYVKIWEWATLSLRFQKELDEFEIYDVYFNDWVSGCSFGGVHDTEVCILVCNCKEQLSVYKVEADMPLVCEASSTSSITFGSWFKRDQFLSGYTEKGINILRLRRICHREGARRAAALPSNEILKRKDIRNAKLLKTFQNNMLLCFKTGRNLEVIHIEEKEIVQLSDSKLFNFDQGNIGFFKLSSDLSGSCQNNIYFTYDLKSKKCKQKLRHQSNLCSVACHPTDQKAVVTSDRGGKVFVWNLDDTL